MKGTKKGQASMEMLMTVGGFLAFLVPIVLLAFSVMNLNKEDISRYAADSMVKQIASEADVIYAQGYSKEESTGASSIIYINIPNNVKRIDFEAGTVVAHMEVNGATYDAVAYTNAKFSDQVLSIENKHGIVPIRIFATMGKKNTVVDVEVLGGNNE